VDERGRMRTDGRAADEVRPVKITRGFTKYAEGSVLVEAGETRILVNCSVQNGVPRWLRGSGKGWLTAEYSMLPRSTQDRNIREVHFGKPSGRTQEIQRLVGRCLRSVVELDKLGENTLWLDCDVLQADGGTRTASITGAFVAVVDALYHQVKKEQLRYIPLNNSVAAVSCGIVSGVPLLDLAYDEDSRAQVDLNVVGTGDGHLVEIQGGAEGDPFSWEQLDALTTLAKKGIHDMTEVQRAALGPLWDEVRAGVARLGEESPFGALKNLKKDLGR